MSALLSTLGLSADAIIARRSSIGGSDANTIMSGKDDRILRLWREKRGELPGEDLSDNLAVQMGSFTEALNVAWFEKQTGHTVDLRGEVCRSDDYGFPMGCTLDGRVAAASAVFEAKHTGTRSTDAELFERYVPQLTHNCLCTGMDRALLSAFKGNGDWVMFEYAVDGDYAASLIEAEAAFWACVQSGEPPVPLPPPPAPKPVGVKEYDMAGSNAWAVHAGVYQETILAADRHELARKELKALVPPDASKCFGGGIVINRDKRGALRFANAGEAA
jgi:predicted phage-related endonuclease